jgi:hypothetical protein
MLVEGSSSPTFFWIFFNDVENEPSTIYIQAINMVNVALK